MGKMIGKIISKNLNSKQQKQQVDYTADQLSKLRTMLCYVMYSLF